MIDPHPPTCIHSCVAHTAWAQRGMWPPPPLMWLLPQTRLLTMHRAPFPPRTVWWRARPREASSVGTTTDYLLSPCRWYCRTQPPSNHIGGCGCMRAGQPHAFKLLHPCPSPLSNATISACMALVATLPRSPQRHLRNAVSAVLSRVPCTGGAPGCVSAMTLPPVLCQGCPHRHAAAAGRLREHGLPLRCAQSPAFLHMLPRQPQRIPVLCRPAGVILSLLTASGRPGWRHVSCMLNQHSWMHGRGPERKSHASQAQMGTSLCGTSSQALAWQLCWVRSGIDRIAPILPPTLCREAV